MKRGREGFFVFDLMEAQNGSRFKLVPQGNESAGAPNYIHMFFRNLLWEKEAAGKVSTFMHDRGIFSWISVSSYPLGKLLRSQITFENS